MKVTILGCGDSAGSPRINCNCEVCSSPDTNNHRFRSSILVSLGNTNILIDPGPDVKHQLHQNKVKKIDFIFLTHTHYDHYGGIEEFQRMTSLLKGKEKEIPLYVHEFFLDNLFSVFKKYNFDSSKKITKVSMPSLKVFSFSDYTECSLLDDNCNFLAKVSFFLQNHGAINSSGIKIGNFVYSTDFKFIPEKSFDYLDNLTLWIVECISYDTKFSHSDYEASLKLIEKVNPKFSVFTHMNHQVEYSDLLIKLLYNKTNKIVPAYDKMRINLDVIEQAYSEANTSN